ncbi:MAG TPA: dihydrolipoamide acetyltransferase family protein [Gemmatimonadales bacterium]|nr:dihydrolipoamide acetyltransferase family protein [Gemmatimonadales bacterium]
MARVDVLMPQMGESIAEGTLSKWLKKLGDEVKRDEPLFEISTDKVDAEIPAPTAGVLVEIKVQEGQTVPVQTLVAVIETDKGATVSAAPQASSATPPVAAPQRAPAAPGGAAVSPPPAPKPAPAPAAPPSAPARPLPSPSVPVGKGGDGVESAEERLRRKSTPLVRKIAAEHQVDIAGIPGSGFAGRVTKNDILGYIERGVPAGAPSAPRSTLSAPSGPIAHPAVDAWPGDRVEPWSKIRKITADHMIMSRRVSAHVTSFFEVDYTRIAELRKKHKASYAERGVNLTYLAFIAKACAANLRKHPIVNAAVTTDATIYRKDVNIGIAVALDWGLIVPVIKHADELSLQGLARAINDLGERARSKKLSPDEIQRGTFTITNPGVFGPYAGIPIINQPQVAILGVGGIEKRPKVLTLPDGSDTIAIRTLGMLTMSYDHRVVDGADADHFLADVKAMLQDFPEQEL